MAVLAGLPEPTLAPADSPVLRLRLAQGARDIAAARALRHLAFFGRPGADADPADPACQHLLVSDTASGRLVACLRLMWHEGGLRPDSYVGRYYDLSALRTAPGPMLEIGRLCQHPDWRGPEPLRLIWGALTLYAEARGASLLFGCSSFAGADPARHLGGLALLRDRYLGPLARRPGIAVSHVLRFADLPAGVRPAPAALPPLLRGYLSLGGWVGDHAVIDTAMDTLHVFTALDPAAVPPRRRRALRTLARAAVQAGA